MSTRTMKILDTVLCIIIIAMIGAVPGIIGDFVFLGLKKKLTQNNPGIWWVYPVSVVTGVVTGICIQIALVFIFKMQ